MARKNIKLVHGIGINDADYSVAITEVIDGRHKIVWRCPIYNAWTSMLMRCYNEKRQEKNPTYIGCTVAPEWHSFMAFRAWMLTQPWEGNQLDKDILIRGNKVYSPGTCVFVPSQLNTFMLDSGATRGEWPIGVCWDGDNGKFRAGCSNPFTRKRENLGRFTCPTKAHEAWRKRKHEHALAYADMQADPRIAKALRTRYVK